MTFAERYLKVLGIEEIEVNKLCKKLLKLTVLNSTLSLKLRTSLLSAAVVTAALNICSSVQMSSEFKVEYLPHLKPAIGGPLRWWSGNVCE